MASTIKGLTIEINGNTTKLTKALTDSKASIKAVDEALKKVNEALKLDPTNVDLLTDRQKLLTDRLKLTNEQLDILKKGLDSIKGSSLNVENKTQEIGKFDAQIAGANASIKQFGKELENTNELIDNDGIPKLTDNIEDLGLKFNIGKLASGDFFGAIETSSPKAAAAIAVISTVVSGVLKEFKETASQIYEITKDITVGIGKELKSGVEFNAEIENYTIRLKNFQQVGEKADEVLKNIQEDALKSPFDIASMIKANSLLLATGREAEDVRKTINALGDAIASAGGSSDALERMAQNLQQISNNGKATAMDIRQFANAGIDVYGTLSQLTGKTTQQLKDMDISYELLSEALIKASQEGGQYFNGMSAMATSLNGRLSQLATKWDMVTGIIATQTSSVFGNLVAETNKALDDVIIALQTGDLDKVGGVIKDWISNCLEIIRKELPSIISYITELVSQVLGALNNDEIKTQLISLAQVLVTSLGEALNKLYPQIKELMANLFNAINILLNDSEIRSILYKIGAQIIGIIFGAVGEKFKSTLLGAIDVTGDLLGTIGKLFPEQPVSYDAGNGPTLTGQPNGVVINNYNNVDTKVDVDAISRKTAQQVKLKMTMK